MGWNYTNKGLSQHKTIGTAVLGLGLLMLVFGVWHFNWNRELVETGMSQVPAARYREMALPATFGIVVVISGILVMYAARSRHRQD